MPKVKTTTPFPTREKGQRSLDLPQYLDRIVPIWRQPEWLSAEVWRSVVANQPFAVICRETLIANVLALDWKIEPRDSTMRDEYKTEIDYYERFIQDTGDYDYAEIIEWIGKDLLDIPFGGVAELGKEGDSPEGKLLWIELLDGGTCYPTLNKDFPIGQLLKELPTRPVYFPAHAINRVYYSPRTEIRRKGWGMPPPEKIYLSLALLNRGDQYYANLLLDTPEVGLLDLGDMEKTSAEEWVQSWKTLLSGIDPFKIPVLYEHTGEIKFINFNRSPTELMFDKATMKYAAICASGYGMSLSDIGMQATSSGGETLAGSIRQERRTRRTGFGTMKKKIIAFFDRMLPEYLCFKFIDLDDEVSVSLGRARLANATAWGQLIDLGVFSPQEARLQTIADGLVSISIPENIPPEVVQAQKEKVDAQKQVERPSMLGRPVAPSAGGQGEVRNSLVEEELSKITKVEDIRLRRLMRSVIEPLKSEISQLQPYEIFEDDELTSWNEWHDEVLWGNIKEEIPELTQYSIATSFSNLSKSMKDEWWKPSKDFKTMALDLLDIFRNTRKSHILTISESMYEKGELDVIPSEVEDNPILERRFVNQLSKELSSKWSGIPDRLRKSIISGTREFLSLYKNANELDTATLLVDNKATEMVRAKLVQMTNIIIAEVAQSISQITNKLLED